MCLIEDSFGLICKPEIIENNTLQFPIYLIYGNNGQVGIDLYNWLETNLDNWNYDTQEIYASNEKVYGIDKRGTTYSLDKPGHTCILGETGYLSQTNMGGGSD
jgi:hypothetical protein